MSFHYKIQKFKTSFCVEMHIILNYSNYLTTISNKHKKKYSMFTKNYIYIVGVITSSQTINECIITLLNGFSMNKFVEKFECSFSIDDGYCNKI